jgi:hypothetical protein
MLFPSTRLGECIASTQGKAGYIRRGTPLNSSLDYLLLDALFELIGRLTPSSKKPKERRTFCVDVFQNEAVHRAFGLEASTKLCETLEAAVGGAWEKVRSMEFQITHIFDAVLRRLRTECSMKLVPGI